MNKKYVLDKKEIHSFMKTPPLQLQQGSGLIMLWVCAVLRGDERKHLQQDKDPHCT